ncbi:hypothetical protein AS593_21410 [Caulobacter vibrioides]|nr:hypothetical protein AS593_21410 [Caulobacter vibrioides]
MADIFISYRMDDSTVLARELARLLRKVGWTVWFAPELAIGDELEEKIDPELAAARCVIGLWSRTAAASPHVEAEFVYAKQHRKLLATITDATPIPEHFKTAIIGNLSKFSMMTYGPDLPQLLRGVAGMIGLPAGFEDVETLIASAVDEEFGFYRLGNITVPAKYLFGSPREPFRPEDVVIHDTDIVHEDRPDYPQILRDAYPVLLADVFTRFNIDASRYHDNSLPRLDGWRQAPELADDSRGQLHLHFSRTTYFQLWATNVGVDTPYDNPQLGRQTTIRQSYCYPPYEDLFQSVLSNNPSVEVVVISENPDQTPARQVLIRRRRLNVAGYRGWFQSSASGHLSLAHRDAAGRPSPFAAAIGEAIQEISHSLDLAPEDFRLIGLTLKEQDFNPSFYGFIQTDRLASELVSDFCRDDYEGKKSAIAFDPETVLRHIVENPWYPLSAMALMATLFTFYPSQEIHAVARRLPVKRVQDFYFEHNDTEDQEKKASVAVPA